MIDQNTQITLLVKRYRVMPAGLIAKLLAILEWSQDPEKPKQIATKAIAALADVSKKKVTEVEAQIQLSLGEDIDINADWADQIQTEIDSWTEASFKSKAIVSHEIAHRSALAHLIFLLLKIDDEVALNVIAEILRGGKSTIDEIAFEMSLINNSEAERVMGLVYMELK